MPSRSGSWGRRLTIAVKKGAGGRRLTIIVNEGVGGGANLIIKKREVQNIYFHLIR